MSKILTLGGNQEAIVNCLLYAPSDWKKRIKVSTMKEPTNIPLFQEGWVTVDFIKQNSLVSVAQTRDLKNRLSEEKKILEISEFKYLNKKDFLNKKLGRKYGFSSREMYRLKQDSNTFKKLFSYYYHKKEHWFFLNSIYCKTNINNPLNDKWVHSLRFVSNKMIKNLKEKKIDLKETKYIPPALLYLIYNDNQKINQDWETYFEYYKDKCFSIKSSSILAFLDLLKAFWTYELFNMSKYNKKKGYNKFCKETLIVINGLIEDIKKNSKPLKNKEASKKK